MTIDRFPRRGYAPGPFGQIHYQEQGAGDPIVLLHQSPMSSFQFDNVYAPLASRGYRAIGIDYPGFGMSDPTPDVPEVADFAEVVVPVLDALGIDRAVILGHHTGALVANEVAIRFPGRVRAVVLNGPLLLSEAERAAFFEDEFPAERNLVAMSGGEHLRTLFGIRELHAKGEVSLERITHYVMQTLMGRGEFWYGHRAAFRYDQEARLPLITQPGLILTNTGDEIYHQAQRAYAMRPDFAFAALEGGGVDIVDQQSDAWAGLVADFMDSLPAHESAN